MKMPRLTALLLVAIGGSICHVAQADAFDDLKTYDFQNRAPLMAIRGMIDTANGDKAQLTTIEAKLDAVLSDPQTNNAGRQEACKFLGQIGSKASVPMLAKLLASDDTESNARYALERISTPEAALALRTAFAAAGDKTKIGIVNSLGDRGDAESVSLLKPLLESKSENAELREAAIAALGKIAMPAALAALQASDDKSLSVSQAMLKAADKIATQKNSSEAEKTYLELTAPGYLPIVRAAALHGLAASHSAQTGKVALAGMKDSDPVFRSVSARVYTGLPEAKTVRNFPEWMGLDAPTQIVLLTGFADYGVTIAMPLIMQSLASSDADLRHAAILAAAKIGGAAAVPKLADIAAHGEGDDKRTARESLIGMTGKEADPAILQTEKAGSPDIQAVLLEVLAARPTAGSRAVLLETAAGNNPKTAVEALRALEKSGTMTEYSAVANLLATATDESVIEAAHNATVAIANRSGDRDIAALALTTPTAVNSPNHVAIIGALAEIGGTHALETLMNLRASKQPEIKAAAITGLAETWSDSAAMPVLLTIAVSETDKATRVQALRGYLRLAAQDDKNSAENRVKDVQSALVIAERPEEKRQALSILRDCRTESAVVLAAAYLENPDVFAEAADAILTLAAPIRRNRVTLPAIKSPATTAALDRIIALAKDDALREQAQKLK